MHITPTQEEFDLLNAIIPHIPYNKDFEVYSLIATIILKPRYPNGKGGTDLSKYDLALKDFRDRGIFKNIDTYLVENYFAEKIGEQNRNNILKLTQKGEVLVAYGSVMSFLAAMQPSTEDEIIERLPDTIAQAFPYGEFIIEPKLPLIQIVNVNIFTPDESGELAKIKKSLEPKKRFKRMYRQSLLDEEVLQYLVNHGFAVNRHDIKAEDKIYRQLTDKGRKLKELGTIQKYREYEKNEQDKIHHQKMRDIYLFWIVLFGSLGTCISAYGDF